MLLPYLSLLFCESLYLKQIVLLDACEFLKFKQFGCRVSVRDIENILNQSINDYKYKLWEETYQRII